MKKTVQFSGVLGRFLSVTALVTLFSFCSLAHADPNTGSKTYLSACAGCHGASADAPGFAPDLRRFQGDEIAFLKTVKNGRPGTIMSGWQGVLSDAEIMSIRSYLKEIPVADQRQQPKDYASQEGQVATR